MKAGALTPAIPDTEPSNDERLWSLNEGGGSHPRNP